LKGGWPNRRGLRREKKEEEELGGERNANWGDRVRKRRGWWGGKRDAVSDGKTGMILGGEKQSQVTV